MNSLTEHTSSMESLVKERDEHQRQARVAIAALRRIDEVATTAYGCCGNRVNADWIVSVTKSAIRQCERIPSEENREKSI